MRDSEGIDVQRVDALLVLLRVVEYAVNSFRALSYGADGDDDPAVAQAALDKVISCHTVGSPERVVLVLLANSGPAQCFGPECNL